MKLLPRKSRKKVQFEVQAEPGSAVFVAGSFNDWNPQQHQLKHTPANGLYRIQLSLPLGIHEYRLIVNGAWCADPTCPNGVPNAYGSMNSVVNVSTA